MRNECLCDPIDLGCSLGSVIEPECLCDPIDLGCSLGSVIEPEVAA